MDEIVTRLTQLESSKTVIDTPINFQSQIQDAVDEAMLKIKKKG